jgi:hypothetical protein
MSGRAIGGWRDFRDDTQMQGENPKRGFRGKLMATKKRYVWIWGAVFLGLAALIAVAAGMRPEAREWIMREGGLVESVSAAGYFVCLFSLMCVPEDRKPAAGPAILAILLIFGLRELDFHTRFTTMGIFKSRFYLSPEVPILEKIIGAAVLLILVGAMAYVAKRHFATFLRGIRRLEPGPFSGLIAIGLLFFTKTVDGLPRKLDGLGLASPEALERSFWIVEEVLEMGIPIFMLIGILAEFPEDRKVAHRSESDSAAYS